MTGEPGAHGAEMSREGEGITIRDDVHCCPHPAREVPPMPDEVPDVPAHLPLTSGRALRAREDDRGTAAGEGGRRSAV
ncbi:hypothetical protein [Streptomyces griseus]|uniref:hypothetical protein n=1 Tax=Streptomyces griseus TaxID=1911 RepID=UPI00083FFEC4|nr:hypothetical protein [Streptomyces griseus]